MRNLKQIGLGIMQYNQDYQRFLFRGQTQTDNPRELLNPYIKSNQLWVCPSETNSDAQAMTSGRNVSYMINGALVPTVEFPAGSDIEIPRGLKDADITRPTEIVMAHDADPGELGWTEGNTWNGGKTTDWPHLRTTGTANGNGTESYLLPWFQRHNGTFNVLYYDGHVKAAIAAPTSLTDANFIP